MFKAPKTATYKFEFSKVKDGRKLPLSGRIYGQILYKNTGIFGGADFKTGKYVRSTLELADRKKNDLYLAKKTGSIKLKKNQKLYMHFDFEPERDIEQATNMTIQLKVK